MAEPTKSEKIEVRLKEYRAEAKEDVKIDRKNLGDSFDNTSKVMKWIDRKVDWNFVCQEIDRKLAKTKRELYEFYRKDYPLKIDNNSDLNMYITSDDQYIAIEREQAMAEATKKFIGDTIETLKARAWETKALADWIKYQNGIIG